MFVEIIRHLDETLRAPVFWCWIILRQCNELYGSTVCLGDDDLFAICRFFNQFGESGFSFCQVDFLHFQFLNVCRFVEVRINIAR